MKCENCDYKVSDKWGQSYCALLGEFPALNIDKDGKFVANYYCEYNQDLTK